MRRLIPLTFLAVDTVHCTREAPPTLWPAGPDTQVQPNTPKGTVTRGVLPAGKYYPGTPHNYSVYVPAQYNAAKPTPFMIFLDGGSANVIFDNLIAKGDIPPMIGIFINPGVLPAIGDARARAERIFEYDSINGRYAQFLIDEVIPEIAKKYNLSKDPNDRGLCGNSTGAVGAFMAAWERPDQFRRVASFIGTFVAMKGADTLPSLIRKSEPKPLRIFMQDGKKDHVLPDQPYGTFFAGSWPINNQVLYEDLQFAGYDVKYELGEAGHDGTQRAAIMPDVLRWLWREYPKPIVEQAPVALNKAGWDPRAQVFSTISVDKPWEQVGASYKSTVSPAPDKETTATVVLRRSGSERHFYKSDPSGKVTQFKEPTRTARKPCGSARTVACMHRSHCQSGSFLMGPRREMRKLSLRTSVADDLGLTLKGAVYFVDSSQKTVGIVDPAGKSRVVFHGDEMLRPAALTLSPDQAMLVVGDSQNKFNWSLQIAADGSLINGEPFFRVDMPDVSPYSGVASVMVDTDGQVYFSTAVGIQQCEQNGRCAAILSKPELGTVTGIAYAGKDLNWIYATEDGKLFRRPALRKEGSSRVSDSS